MEKCREERVFVGSKKNAQAAEARRNLKISHTQKIINEKKTAPNFKPRLVTVENNSHRSADGWMCGWMCGWMIFGFIHLCSRRGIISSIFLLHQPFDTQSLISSIRWAIISFFHIIIYPSVFVWNFCL
jgi:hypothetical protein